MKYISQTYFMIDICQYMHLIIVVFTLTDVINFGGNSGFLIMTISLLFTTHNLSV